MDHGKGKATIWLGSGSKAWNKVRVMQLTTIYTRNTRMFHHPKQLRIPALFTKFVTISLKKPTVYAKHLFFFLVIFSSMTFDSFASRNNSSG